MIPLWKRPENIPFPSVWSRFEGKKEINGKIPKFWIQDIPENIYDVATDIMFKSYINEEPLCKFSNIIDDEESLEDLKTIWMDLLKYKLGLICFMENSDPNGKPIIAGINFTYPSVKGYIHPKKKGVTWCRITEATSYLRQLKNPCEILGIDAYMNALGLSVLPEFRGQGIGEELLKARFPLCKAVGLKATVNMFSAIASQKLAEKVGFKDLIYFNYDELEKINPKFSFPGISEHTKSIRYMYKLID